MAARRSAGLLLYDTGPSGAIEVMLAHMGGPFWARRDEGAWTIPKGEHADDEDALAAARREFAEELGFAAPEGELTDLGEIRQSGGKRVRAWALRARVDVEQITSNTFELEWPPRSGATRSFPEVDRAAWFDLPTARAKIVKGQIGLLDALAERVGGGQPPASTTS
jgi:predicted NUDIX family NTP pyrophosphohydrolase